jgi:signal transduction histidine kinase/ActR/RegA family two-component response regulator
LGTATDLLHSATVAAAALLAAVAVHEARRHRNGSHWGAAAFAALAAVLFVAEIDSRPDWLRKLMICVLIAFPYLLLRFTASFRAVSPSLVHLATAGWLVLVAAQLILPPVSTGPDRSAWSGVYVSAALTFWTALSVVTVVKLWRLGAGQPTVLRRRARLMSAGTAGMNVLILLVGTNLDEGVGDLVFRVLLLLFLAAFALGFSPPQVARLAWRQPEEEALQQATVQLAGATTVPQVMDILLPHVARIVAAPGAAVLDEHGETVAAFGDAPVTSVPPADGELLNEVIPLSPPFRSLVVVTGPLTPFFGREEIRLLHALGALADISLARCVLTERQRQTQEALKSAAKAAEQANTAKSDFLSRMSHELRTPLNVVLGFGQILELRGALDKEDAAAVEHILKAGRHLLALINEVLDLSRIESGKMAISPEPVPLAELVTESLDLVRPMAAERSVALSTGLADCHQHVTADRQRLKQVLLNLFSNAIKYNRDGGRVEVSCARAGDGRLRVSVSDTGPGIPAPLIDRLFEPFERLNADATGVEGTGLGLSLSRQLVELMGGAIGVNTHEGEGSVFWVELRLAASPGDSGDEGDSGVDQDPPDVPPGDKRRLLLVEDNLANLKVIRSALSRRPHIDVLPAMTGSMGLELAREQRPDVILLDQHLPDITGTEALHRLKADPLTRSIPVVVVSADATHRQIRRTLELGAVEYLTKPLDLPTFLRVVDAALDAGEVAAS